MGKGNMKNILLILWLAMNAFTFCLYGIDKHKAKHGAWRIPEKTLLTFTWLLGGRCFQTLSVM